MVIARLRIAAQQLLADRAELHLRRRALHRVNVVARGQPRRLLLLIVLLSEYLVVPGGLREEGAAESVRALRLLKNLTA